MFLTLTYLLTCTQVKHTCTVSGDMHPVAPVLALVMARHTHTPVFSQTSYQPSNSSQTPFLSTLLQVLALRLIASWLPQLSADMKRVHSPDATKCAALMHATRRLTSTSYLHVYAALDFMQTDTGTNKSSCTSNLCDKIKLRTTSNLVLPFTPQQVC